MDTRGVNAIAEEIAKEKAESLGLTGKALESTLRELREYEQRHGPNPGDPQHGALVARAAERVTHFIVQREAFGFADPSYVFEFFAVPPAVVARLGARGP